MQTETRVQDDPGLANRYLAGQLSPDELQAYEQHLLENPDAARELEATARMKVGLANLRDSGQLEGLLRARTEPRWRWPSLAVAAALVLLAVGLWRSVDVPREATMVATAGELLDRTGQPLTTGSSYALLRTRSSAYDAVIELPPQPRAIELRVRPETAAPAYSVALSRIHADGSVLQIGTVSELQAQSDGFVRLYVASSRLESGPYLFVITPAADRTAASTTAFRVKVVTPERQP
jgi:anti-sigma-K factor RskA